MTGPGEPPLLFLDVDGPLIPFGPREGGHREHLGGPWPPGGRDHPLLARIDPALGPRLAALPCEAVWATTWEDDANALVAPRLGLPALPVVHWPAPSETDEADARAGLHWKTRALVALAAGRPFVWVDDEITGADRRWVAERHAGRALLHRVAPAVGLTAGDLRLIDDWLRTV
ncbi:HAD domain-containing protein [Streptomyces sp. NPDC001515]